MDPTNKQVQTALNRLEQLIDTRTLVFPVVKTEAVRSNKPLRRIEIQEINGETTAERQEMAKTREEMSKRVHLSAKDELLFETSSSSAQAKRIIELSSVETVAAERLSDVKVVNNQPTPATISDNKPKPVIQSLIKTIPPVPPNAYQFRKDWQHLEKSPEDLAAYFKVGYVLLSPIRFVS